MANPNLPEGQRAVAKTLLEKALAESSLTGDQKEYLWGKAQGFPGTFQEWMVQTKKPQTNVNVGGGSDKQIFDALSESANSARSAATGLASIREARRAVEEGGIFGAGADLRLGLQKVAAMLGADPTRVINTETFRSAIAPQVAATMRATVGSTQISNADREFAEKAAGGAITLEPASIQRLLGIMERANNVILEQHEKKLSAVERAANKMGNSFERERALFEVQRPDMTRPEPAGTQGRKPPQPTC